MDGDERIVFRGADPADAHAIRRVARASWHSAYDSLLPPEIIDETVDVWYDPESLTEQVREGSFVVAEDVASLGEGDDALVGFAHAVGDDLRNRAEIRRIYVLEEYWGTGLGTDLLSATVAPLSNGAYDRINAVVLAENEVGRAFYDARGFEVVDRKTTTLGGVDREEVVLAAPMNSLVE